VKYEHIYEAGEEIYEQGKLEEKSQIVTAGGSGIGAATRARFAREKASVVVADLSGTRASARRWVIAQEGGNAANWLKMDASDPEGVQGGYPAGHGQLGPARRDVQQCGDGKRSRRSTDGAGDLENRTLAVTLTSAFLGIKYSFADHARTGRRINRHTASISARPATMDVGLHAAKAASTKPRARGGALDKCEIGIRINWYVRGGDSNYRVSQVLGGNDVEGFKRRLAQITRRPEWRARGRSQRRMFLASDEASSLPERRSWVGRGP